MVRPEGDHDGILGGGRLQLEVEAAAEPLAQRQAPGAIHPAPERRVQHQLHPPRFVEEALQHQRLLCGNDAEDLVRRVEILDDLPRRGLGQAGDLAAEPGERVGHIPQPARDVLAQPRDLHRQLGRAPGCFAGPEGDGGRLPLRVHHPYLAGFDLLDQVRAVAELEDVARHALDREVFVERADERLGRLEHHAIIADVGDRAPRRERGEAGAAPGLEASVHAVVMHVRAAAPAPGREPVGEHLHHRIEVFAREIAVRVGPAHQLVQRRLVPLFARHRRDHLLRENVERVVRDDQPVELPLARRPQQRRALDQLVARQRKHPSLGHGGQMMARAAHPLQQRRDRSGRADLAHQIHGADVDPQLERGGGDERLQLPVFEAGLRIEPLFLGEAAVVRRDLIRPQALGEMQREPLRQPPGVHEHQRRAVLRDQLHQPLVDLVPHLGRHHRLERRRRDLDREIERAGVAGVNDLGKRDAGCGMGASSDEEAGYLLDGLLRGREPDALEATAGQVLQPLERQREMAAPLVARQGVNLVHDHGPHAPQHLACALGREDQVERLGSCDEDVWRPPHHLLPRGRRRVAGAHQGADLHVGQAQRFQRAADLGQRLGQVLLDVVRERLQRGDVHHLRAIAQRAVEPLAQQRIDRRQEGGERLAGSRGRRDQGVAPGLDQGPGVPLRLGRLPETRLEPALDGRMEALKRHTEIWLG